MNVTAQGQTIAENAMKLRSSSQAKNPKSVDERMFLFYYFNYFIQRLLLFVGVNFKITYKSLVCSALMFHLHLLQSHSNGEEKIVQFEMCPAYRTSLIEPSNTN